MGLLDELDISATEIAVPDKKTEQKPQEVSEKKEAEEKSIRIAAMDRADPYRAGIEKVLERVPKEIAEKLSGSEDKDGKEKFRERVENLIDEVITQEIPNIPWNERRRIVTEVSDDVLGFGPMEPLLRDSSVSEIMVNGPKRVYVERKGKLILSDVKFRDNNHVLHVLEKIVAPLGRRIDESSPMVDARLPDGSRVNAIIPPLALNGPTITIRKFFKERLGIKDLVKFGTLTAEMAEFIEACVKVRLNIVVSGGTGSGKTTTLNILSSFIPDDERIITVEDAAELQLQQDHVVSLETRPANAEGKGSVTIRDLVKNTLRMRPERIVVGEIRGGEALDMLQAMNTGHDGSLTTGHANTPRDMLRRLETMVLMSGVDLPIKAIREQIASAVDLIVQQSRLKDGSRKITHITEIQGMEGDTVVIQDIFVFKQTGMIKENGKDKIIGYLEPTGLRPKFTEKLEASGIHLPPDIFTPKGIY